ncbi:MAG: hypothetical protein K6B74_04840 [Ruminococcus sp.]|nr:hypothetical protein [Ruminococcus sp.]
MNKTDKKVSTAILAPFAGAFLLGLYCATAGITFMFSKTYGFESFVIGAIAGFVITLAAEICFLTAAWVIKKVKCSCGSFSVVKCVFHFLS